MSEPQHLSVVAFRLHSLTYTQGKLAGIATVCRTMLLLWALISQGSIFHSCDDSS